MFKFFAVVFAAILALSVAAPNPGLVASSLVASPLAYSAPLTYSAPLSYASGYAPLAYSSYGSYAYPSYAGYSSPIVQY